MNIIIRVDPTIINVNIRDNIHFDIEYQYSVSKH